MKIAQTLLKIISTINSQLDSEQALTTILEQLAQLVEFDSASIMLLEGDMLKSVVQYSIHTPQNHILEIPYRNLLHTKKVILQKQAVHICDTHANSDWLARQGNETIRCWLGVPLTVRGNVIGILNLSNGRPNTFNNHDIEVVTAFATHVAAVVLNVRLFTEVQQELQERRRVEEELRRATLELEQRVEERTAELQLVNAKLTAALQIKDTIIANVSHEFRNPLNVILLLADSAEKRFPGKFNEQCAKVFTKVKRNALKLSVLVSDMIDLSKLGSGTFEICFHRVSVQDICSNSIALVRNYAESRHIALVQRLQTGDKKIYVDDSVLVQVLVKLLENAIKFSPEESQVVLEVIEDTTKPIIHFTVIDTGIGIAENELDLIFHPFTQVDSKTTRSFEGAGLGLALVQHLVELHNGRIVVDSTPGRGSCFTVSIPLAQEAVVQAD